MFKTHQKMIQDWVRADASGRNFGEVVRFVLCTIQTPLFRAVDDYQTLCYAPSQEEFEDAQRRTLFGYKSQGWAKAGEDCELWYKTLCDMWATTDCAIEAEAIMTAYLVRHVPGLGFAKAGFVLQMAFGISGCIDTHNLKRFGIPERHFRADGVKRWGTLRRKALAYNDFVRSIGGTGKLWDTWCEYVAENQPLRYRSAWEVSELHAKAFYLVD